jgi:phage tail-like protein
MQAVHNGRVVYTRSSYLEYLPALFRRELDIDLDTERIWVAGREVKLDEQEFKIIALLYQGDGRIFSAHEIGVETGLSEGAIQLLVNRIRNVIEADPSNPRFLKYIMGEGFRLDCDEFMGRFLLIFENILKPLEHAVDNLALYFDPLFTTPQLLPWLASWLGLVLDSNWPEEKRRRLVKAAPELFRWQGTKKGLSDYLELYTGRVPEISEEVSGIRLGPEARLGINTRLGSSGGGCHFTVLFDLEENSDVDTNTIKTIIEQQKPAHTVYTLKINRAGTNVEASDGT